MRPIYIAGEEPKLQTNRNRLPNANSTLKSATNKTNTIKSITSTAKPRLYQPKNVHVYNTNNNNNKVASIQKNQNLKKPTFGNITKVNQIEVKKPPTVSFSFFKVQFNKF